MSRWRKGGYFQGGARSLFCLMMTIYNSEGLKRYGESVGSDLSSISVNFHIKLQLNSC